MKLNERSIRGIMGLVQIAKCSRGGAINTPRPDTITQEVMMQDYTTLPLFSLQEKTKEIPLTQGKVAIVSVCDYDWLMQWKWYASYARGRWYARRNLPRRGKNQVQIPMHRVIMGTPEGLTVDHIDGNTLNNTRGNLRLATREENMHNSRTPSNNTSGFKGVSWHKTSRRWQAYIGVDSCRRYIGTFDTAEAAALAYNEAALRFHGDFARLNEVIIDE